MNKQIIYILISLFIFCSNINAVAANKAERNNFLGKYKYSKEFYGSLKDIFKADMQSKDSVNALYNGLDKLKLSSKSEASEILVGLLDFYIGEMPNEIVKESIVAKGKTILPLLRNKLMDSVIMNEFPNENNIKIVLEKRNATIITLMDYIYYNVPYVIDYSALNKKDVTKLKLFLIQNKLQKYKITKGYYPSSLSQLNNELSENELDFNRDAWNRSFKYYSGQCFYFLLLRQLKMLILGGIGNFRMLEVSANMRRSFNKRFHERTGFRFQIFLIANRFP